MCLRTWHVFTDEWTRHMNIDSTLHAPPPRRWTHSISVLLVVVQIVDHDYVQISNNDCNDDHVRDEPCAMDIFVQWWRRQIPDRGKGYATCTHTECQARMCGMNCLWTCVTDHHLLRKHKMYTRLTWFLRPSTSLLSNHIFPYLNKPSTVTPVGTRARLPSSLASATCCTTSAKHCDTSRNCFNWILRADNSFRRCLLARLRSFRMSNMEVSRYSLGGDRGGETCVYVRVDVYRNMIIIGRRGGKWDCIKRPSGHVLAQQMIEPSMHTSSTRQWLALTYPTNMVLTASMLLASILLSSLVSIAYDHVMITHRRCRQQVIHRWYDRWDVYVFWWHHPEHEKHDGRNQYGSVLRSHPSAC